MASFDAVKADPESALSNGETGAFGMKKTVVRRAIGYEGPAADARTIKRSTDETGGTVWRIRPRRRSQAVVIRDVHGLQLRR